MGGYAKPPSGVKGVRESNSAPDVELQGRNTPGDMFCDSFTVVLRLGVDSAGMADVVDVRCERVP